MRFSFSTFTFLLSPVLNSQPKRLKILRGMDSNHEWEIQSLLCYHYTTPECLLGTPRWFPSTRRGEWSLPSATGTEIILNFITVDPTLLEFKLREFQEIF